MSEFTSKQVQGIAVKFCKTVGWIMMWTISRESL
jgi:hypothetical protein